MRPAEESAVLDLIGLIGFGSFLAVSCVLSVRLLGLARRTRQLPEFAIGVQFLLAGVVGYGLLIASESLRLLPGSLADVGAFAGVTAISLGAIASGVFSARVFHSGSKLASAAQIALASSLLLGIIGSWTLHVGGATSGTGAWLGRWVPNLGILAAYGWSSFAPLRYAAAMRRRAQIGLGDALVANRMQLWGIGTGAIAGIALLHLVAQFFGHYELPASLVGLASSLALVTAVAEWLAFFPPRSYRRRFATPLSD